MNDHNFIVIGIIGTLIFLSAFIALVVLMIVLRKKMNQHHHERQQLLLAVIRESERTLQQVSREVHDNIGQLASLHHMTVRRIEKTLDAHEREQLFESAYRISALIESNCSNLGYSLNGDYIKERGLSNMIQDDIEHIRAAGEINCHVDIVGDVRSLGSSAEVVIYRIAQEAIRNVIKHASATVLDTRLYYNDDDFELVIRDNGNGFDIEKIGETGGLGISNMKERAQVLQGKLKVASIQGVGSCIIVTIPYSSKDIMQGL
ncbi:histidine kinase/DNA gyrase B/HSP90-like ATPase [Mucilaginibacter gracilis]|uniref:histidine kinase n=1 Tax=Mucilaginibacter gracilis TaxID=423350 RepID=A0A495IVB1_9SPHI|nr:ATP-binding protein [Mucilaginibacter gracilis]RKR80697.1 histidine kinase/DNA gyrase B/HSP90-like ATPase [Mucilaginibacter gracilis]